MYNGLYHHCKEGNFTYEYHCCYIRGGNDDIKCRYCKKTFPSILLAGFTCRAGVANLRQKNDHFFVGDWVSQELLPNTRYIDV